MISRRNTIKYYFVSVIIFTTHNVLKPTDAYESYEEFYREMALTTGPTTSYLVNKLWNSSESTLGRVSKQCRENIINFKNGVSEGEEWALKMLDSSSHVQSGYLEGNKANNGNYDECLNINNYNQSIKGQYCKVVFTVDNKKDPYSEYRYSTLYQPTIMGICVPSSCTYDDVWWMLEEPIPDVSEVSFCRQKIDTELNPTITQYSIISVFGAIATLVLLGTIYDVLFQDENHLGRKIQGKFTAALSKFSVVLNGNNLLKEDVHENSIKCLHGIRFISACGIVIVHRNLKENQPFTNSFTVDTEITKLNHMFILNAYLFVDVFFLMSGLLVSYTFLNRNKYKKSFNPLSQFLHRYIRLTPPLAAVIMFVFLLNLFCNGLFCISGVEAPYEQELCHNTWYYTILYINNMIDVTDKCMGHSWYLTADMQLFVLSFGLLYLMINIKNDKYILFILLFLLSISMATTYYLSHAYELTVVPFAQNDILIKEAEHVYEPFYTRAGPWLIGFGLGIIIYNVDASSFKLKKNFSVAGWVMAVVCIISASFGLYIFAQYGFDHHQMKEYLYKSTYRNVWALGFAWIIFACHTGHGGNVNNFLSCQLFQPLSRLTYCLYLVHPYVQDFLMSDQSYPRNFSDKSQLSIYVADIILSLIPALILHFGIEAPTQGLEKLFKKSIKDRNYNAQPTELVPPEAAC